MRWLEYVLNLLWGLSPAEPAAPQVILERRAGRGA